MFTPQILKAATDGFSRKNLVAKNEGVDIYRGALRDGTKVRFEIYLDGISRESKRRFVEECKVLAQLRHKNIFRVLGWSNSRRLRALVTEWVESKSDDIWQSDSDPPWKQRLKMAAGVVEDIYRKTFCRLTQTLPVKHCILPILNEWPVDSY
ncbi:Cysteine-rich receptor-like protein kinase 7 [Morella rubra]|uniref:Cysteine-rich receptor-like protein kinase 7 n=1 Tax=Morella rubra TaxID=262757 RepID=A0A6A1W780_9ROSI|nr:Cysteine-rich receptor-like protein kinase 7 [Morella rubra]